MSFMLQIAGYLADWVRIKGYWTTRQTRRYFNCIAFIAQTVCMLMAAFFLQPVASVTFITLGVALASFAYSSFSVNYLGENQLLDFYYILLKLVLHFADIAPQFAGVLMGICNSFATVAGIISPILTGYIVTTPSEMEWKIIFFITSKTEIWNVNICINILSQFRRHLPLWLHSILVLGTRRGPALGNARN